MAQTWRVRVVTARHGGSFPRRLTVPQTHDILPARGDTTNLIPVRDGRRAGVGKAVFMKRFVSLLLLVSAGLFLCVLSFFCAFRHRVEQPDDLEVVQQGQASLEQAELPVAEENAPVAEQAVAAVPEIASVTERSSVAAKTDASLLPVAVPPAVEAASSSAGAGVSARPDAAAAKPSSENVANNDPAGTKDVVAVASAELSRATKNAAHKKNRIYDLNK